MVFTNQYAICTNMLYIPLGTMRMCVHQYTTRRFDTKASIMNHNKYSFNYIHTYIRTYTVNDLTCRWCQSNLETQKHILLTCPYFTKITNKTPYKTYFLNYKTATTKTAKNLHKIHPIVESKPYNILTNTTEDIETSNT